ncbi:glycosyltransferase [bacterium]|nr:glycosyltransferase [bacterium]
MSRTLDLCFNHKLNIEVSDLFNAISNQLRSEFNNLVADISSPFKTNLDWWVQGPASRNTFASPFFHNFCSLHLIKKLIDQKRFIYECILVDSSSRRHLVEAILRDNNVKCHVKSHRGALRDRIKRHFIVPALAGKKIIQLFIARGSGRINVEELKEKQLVLIDTFMMSDYTEDDRWYGKLWPNLPEKMKDTTYFVPTIVQIPVRKMAQTYRELRQNVRNFLIKEDFLSLGDILYAVRHQRRVKKIRIKSVTVLGYDISSLIENELYHNRDLLTVIESILTYRFVHNIRKTGLRVRLAIDWFEGHAIDKAWNSAFNTVYPGVKTIGYRAFESFPLYLCSYPIQIEKDSGVLPDVMAVQGKGTISTVREFLPELNVIVIPSFKATYVWDFKKKNRKENQISALVTLPISLKTSARIIQQLVEADAFVRKENRSIVYTIKCHPTQNVELVKSSLDILLSNSFLFTTEKLLSPLIHQADLLISEASSCCLEALACGIPVIMLENQEGWTFDSIPAGIPKEIVRKIRTISQFAQAIDYFMNVDGETLEKWHKLGQKIRSDYFEPLSNGGLARFFDVEEEQIVFNYF